jgi:hypothetical protein
LARLLPWVTFLVPFWAVPAFSQNRVIAITGKAGAEITANCKAQIDLVGRLILKYPHPNEWSWYVACDDKTWIALARHLGIEDPSRQDAIYAATSLKQHSSYIRGPALRHLSAFVPSPDHVIAHELAHIYTGSRDEIIADDLSLQWLSEPGLRDRPAYSDLRAER